MSTLRYRDGVDDTDQLAVGECFAARCTDDKGPHWVLWYRVTDKHGEDLISFIPIEPGGVPRLPGGSQAHRVRPTWDLKRTATATWQISPSIRVQRDDGSGGLREAWHETPMVVAVPEPPPWERA